MRPIGLKSKSRKKKSIDKNYLIFGVIKDSQTKEVLPNLTIEIAYASPSGLSFGPLESDTTDINGNFAILLNNSTAKKETTLDVILRVKSTSGLLIHQAIFSDITPNGCCDTYEIYIDHASTLINSFLNELIPDALSSPDLSMATA